MSAQNDARAERSTTIEQCSACGDKIRDGQCRSCGWQPSRLDEIAHQLTEGGGPSVALVVELAQMLETGAEFDEVRTRLGDLADLDYTGWPEGAVIVNGGPAAGPDAYTLVLDGAELDGRYGEYCDALDHLRIAVEHALSCEPAGEIGDVPITYMSLATGLKIELPRLPDIREDWDRPVNPEHESFFEQPAVSREAFCALCGETCNPHAVDEMTHNVRLQSDEQPCGGPLVPVGWWK